MALESSGMESSTLRVIRVMVFTRLGTTSRFAGLAENVVEGEAERERYERTQYPRIIPTREAESPSYPSTCAQPGADTYVRASEEAPKWVR
jgi:hypothetical protein